jgi:hypothetical protein
MDIQGLSSFVRTLIIVFEKSNDKNTDVYANLASKPDYKAIISLAWIFSILNF